MRITPITDVLRSRRLGGVRPRGLRYPAATLGALAAFCVMLGAPASAFAGVGLGVVPTFPPVLSVGQTGLPASITLTNISTPPESGGNVVVDSITSVPSCGVDVHLPGGDCPLASANPGVLAYSPQGMGRSGTGCSGVTFTISVINPATGQVKLTSPTPVSLTAPGTANARCIIDFTFDVLKTPPHTRPPNATSVEYVSSTFTATIDQISSDQDGRAESRFLPAPQIALTKVASPLSLPAPGGNFTFTAQVSNPSTTTPVTITGLVDNIYGDLATRTGSTCGALIGVVLAPGGTSPSCSFTGPFTGAAGAQQTDTITVTGMNNGVTVTATANATVSLTPPPAVPAVAVPVAAVTPPPPPVKKVVAKHKKKKHHKPRRARKHHGFTG